MGCAVGPVLSAAHVFPNYAFFAICLALMLHSHVLTYSLNTFMPFSYTNTVAYFVLSAASGAHWVYRRMQGMDEVPPTFARWFSAALCLAAAWMAIGSAESHQRPLVAMTLLMAYGMSDVYDFIKVRAVNTGIELKAMEHAADQSARYSLSLAAIEDRDMARARLKDRPRLLIADRKAVQRSEWVVRNATFLAFTATGLASVYLLFRDDFYAAARPDAST